MHFLETQHLKKVSYTKMFSFQNLIDVGFIHFSSIGKVYGNMVVDSMDSDNMVDKLGRWDSTGKTDIEYVVVFFCDVFHNCHNRSHHTFHIRHNNQIVA